MLYVCLGFLIRAMGDVWWGPWGRSMTLRRRCRTPWGVWPQVHGCMHACMHEHSLQSKCKVHMIIKQKKQTNQPETCMKWRWEAVCEVCEVFSSTERHLLQVPVKLPAWYNAIKASMGLVWRGFVSKQLFVGLTWVSGCVEAAREPPLIPLHFRARH